MNKKGFTLVELLATLVILGIIMSIVLISTTGGFKNAKNKTEDVFIGTIEDALEIYLDSDARKLNFNELVCTINKTHREGVNIYKAASISFSEVINSEYSPLSINDMHNPANKDSKDEAHPYLCKVDELGALTIYRDDDYVYYYKLNKSALKCLNTTGDITNLPAKCAG